MESEQHEGALHQRDIHWLVAIWLREITWIRFELQAHL